MSEVRNALQAASNTAAGTVAGPVDMLAWALRKAGVPVPEDPVLGTEWMRQRGLIGDVKPGVSQMAGDTLGLLSPIAAAAYGPQIARGLLKGGENLAQPRTLNPETGAIVWHGSPHKFDKFDSSKIGTGEGAQAYGHGLYLADTPDVAKGYARDVSGAKIKDAVGFQKASDRNATASAVDFWEAMKAGRVPRDLDAAGKPVSDKYIEKQIDGLTAELAKLDEAFGVSPQLYKVDLPDEAIAKMLDWDAKLSEQPEVLAYLQKNIDSLPRSVKVNVASGDKVKSSLTGADFYNRVAGNPDALAAIGPRPPAGRVMQGAAGNFGRMEYDELGQSGASRLLGSQGIPGIRYLDGGSRNKTQWIAKSPRGGENVFNSKEAAEEFIKRNPELTLIPPDLSRNYVIFPGEEGILKILERNGQGLLGP